MLAEAHQICLAGWERYLEADFDIAGEVSDGLALVDAVRTLKPDVAVMEIDLPSLSGMDVVRQLKEDGSPARFVILTTHDDRSSVREALEAGASAYVLKNSARDYLVSVVRAAARGEVGIVSPGIDETAHFVPADDELDKLTARQREVMQLLAQGLTRKEIAFQLEVSVRTIEFHKYELMRRLDLRNTAGLITAAVRLGMISA